MKKKLFTLLTLALMSIGTAWGAAVGDLKTISTDYVFIADEITSNGTTKLTANTLYDGNVIFAPTANSVSASKGSVTFEGADHLNSLRLKNTQDQLCFKVSGACTVTFYTQSQSTRGILVGSEAGGEQYGRQTASTTEWSCNITAAGVVYLSSYNADFYFAGFKVTFPKTDQPTIGTNPVSAKYNQGASATALSVSATAANDGALSYQWYKNETNKSALDAEGAEAIDGATSATYTPSTTEAGTTYYFCKVTEEGNANVATTRIATVKVSPAGYTVTYSLGDVTGTVGTLPEGADHVTSVTIPTNKTLYKDGYTLTAWNDGSADHALGSEMTVTANTTLTPVFTANGASTYLGRNASTATWNFNNNTGAPTWDMNGSGTFVYVTQTSVGGNSMDVMMMLDATGSGAKIASNGNWTQVNTNSKLTIPAVTGAVVKVYTYSDAANPTFNGNAGTFDSTNKIYSYTATADGDVDIVYGGNDYANKVEVEYPSESALLIVSANNTIVPLTKANINSVDYLSVNPTDKWNTGKTYGDYSGDFFNMSDGRKLTMKVTGASTFELFVSGDNGRSYTVKVGDAAASTVTFTTKGIESSGVIAIADASAETTIEVTGAGESVYPVYAVFNKVAEPAKPTTSGEEVYLTTTANMEGWRTFFDKDQAYTVDANTTVYAAQTDAGKINVVSFTGGIPKNTPVILHTTAVSREMTLTKATSVPATVPTPNILNATTAASTDLSAGTYRLGYKSTNGVGFYSYSSATAPAGIVYILKSDVTGGGAPGFLDFFIDEDNTESGEATGIDAIEKAQKADGVYYNVNGQRVAQPTKGLYIVNGRKVVIK